MPQSKPAAREFLRWASVISPFKDDYSLSYHPRELFHKSARGNPQLFAVSLRACSITRSRARLRARRRAWLTLERLQKDIRRLTDSGQLLAAGTALDQALGSGLDKST